MSSLVRTDSTEYSIRSYRPADRDGFLSLYEAVWGRAKGDAWFDWRFEQDPYTDGLEMVVAESNGTIVGAEPVLPFRIAAGDETLEARQPVDWIVHADHRRRGLFTRMTTYLLETHQPQPALYFNFPADALRPGLQKFDWTEVGDVAIRYRVQNPANVIDGSKRMASKAMAMVGRVGSPVTKACLGAVERTAPDPPDGVHVERVAGTATEHINQVYAATRPDVFHVPRTNAFLDWRFANPRWETTSYVAYRDDRPIATTIVGVESIDGTRVARLLDIQPMITKPDRSRAVAALLKEVLRDHRDADILTAPAAPYPALLRRYGFIRDDGLLLSPFSSTTTHAIRPQPTPDDTTLLGRDAADPANWRLLLGDLDIE